MGSYSVASLLSLQNAVINFVVHLPLCMCISLGKILDVESLDERACVLLDLMDRFIRCFNFLSWIF